MTEILHIDYSNDFQLRSDFDLNNLRKLRRVKKVGNKYIAEEDSDRCFTVEFIESSVAIGEEAEKINIDDLKQDSQNRFNWWQKEQKRANELQEKLNCAQLEIQQLKEESNGNPS